MYVYVHKKVYLYSYSGFCCIRTYGKINKVWSALYPIKWIGFQWNGWVLVGLAFVCFPIFIFGKLTSQTLETHISCRSDIWIRLFFPQFSITKNGSSVVFIFIYANVLYVLKKKEKNQQRHSYEDSEQIKAISFWNWILFSWQWKYIYVFSL